MHIHDRIGGSALRHMLNATGLRRNTFEAGGPPSPSDDAAAGYETGSLWLHGGITYVCRDAAPGAAVWEARGAAFDSAADLLASGRALAPGARVFAGPHDYRVVAANEHLTTAGGVGLRIAEDGLWSPRAFGAVSGAECGSAIQRAEDAAAAFAAETGSPVTLEFPAGVYYLAAPVIKRAGVHWRGDGRLCRRDNLAATGAAFALVIADGVDDWSIDGLTLENVAHDRIDGGQVTQNFTLGGGNSCVHVSNCDRWSITNCSLLRFSRGIMYWECDDFRIAGNRLRATTGKTLASMIDGTFTNFANVSTNTFGIGIGYRVAGTTGPVPASRRGIISENNVEVVGLDIAIEGLSQTYDQSPMTITGNVTVGGNASCQCYRGSFDDPGGAPTYHGGMIIAHNRFTYSWQQGLYQRGNVGSIVMGNHFERNGMFGQDNNNSAAAICLRVNPFQSGPRVESIFVSATAGTVSNDHVTVVTGNRIVNHGKADGPSAAAVIIELDHVLFQGNGIERSAEFSDSAQGKAIYVGNGKSLRDVTVRDNEILGAWARGISIEETPGKRARMTDGILVAGNRLRGSFGTAIYCLWYSLGATIEHNAIAATCEAGIRVAASPKSKVRNNTIAGSCGRGIQIDPGCLLSDIPDRLSGGAISAENRRGGSVVVTGNDVSGAVTAFAVSGTNSDDAWFQGRCVEFGGNLVDGAAPAVRRPGKGGTPAMAEARIWNVGETTLAETLLPGKSPGRICVSPGQGGSAVATTGDISLGSPVVTNVASLDGYAPGLFVSPAGFPPGRRILAIDIATSTLTLDAEAEASAAGVTLSLSVPVFAALPALGS